MDERIKALVEYTQAKLGLTDYYLKRHSFRRQLNLFNETVYIMAMEWFPNHVPAAVEDDFNPEGTAVVEMEFQSRRLKSAIFVGGKSYARGMRFPGKNAEDIAKWLEQETGLQYGRHFQIRKVEKGKFVFKGCFQGIPVVPQAIFEVEVDEEGKLTSFSVCGDIPSPAQIREEEYNLSLDTVAPVAREQVKLLEFPALANNQKIPLYAVEEIYVTNEGFKTLPVQLFAGNRRYVAVDTVMTWESALPGPFVPQKIEIKETVTAEQALAGEASPDGLPITEAEQAECIRAVQDLLRREYAEDSGKWVLKTLHREHGYIYATLKLQDQRASFFQRKLVVILDAESYIPLDYVDNRGLLEIVNRLPSPPQPIVTEAEAYEKIKDVLELTPCYVYDFDLRRYRLCGKLDCDYAVNAVSGEMIALDDLML